MSAAFTGADGKIQIPGRGTAPRYPSRGEMRIINGKPVVADGKGNWVDGSNPRTPMSERSTVGTYNPGLRFPSVKQIEKGEYGTGSQKPGAPAQPAVDSNGSNGSRGENRSGVTPVNGSFRTAVEQGPDGKVTPSSGNAGGAQSTNTSGSGYIAPTGGGEPRVNANGLLAYGKDLSSLNQFTREFTGGYELTDIKSAFQSNDLPESQKGDANRTDYSYDSPGEEGVWNDQTGRLEMPSVPGTTGGNPDDAQDGTSDKPDVADNVRQIRMERKRNQIRSAFLDMDTPIIQASVKANAIAGYGKDSDGNARFNYGGELVYAKEGMEQKAKNAAMMGQDPSQYLDIPATPDTQPDTPAASELSITPQSTVKPGTIEVPENSGGSLETPASITKPSPEKFKQAQDFLTKNMQMLNRRTK